ncbi:MAG: TonB-dependent siderophore receptor [Pseudomonadota bacterium]|nr:TonB-dependent siderophore receptor [Pseudomonadota bacterium]
MLAASFGSWAQSNINADQTLKTVTVTETAEAPEGKDSVRATETTIGKGKQKLRDIPQSVTVVTEKLMDDRNLDTFKEALKNTSGISFVAAEGGESDIKLRGFSLSATGDIFADGMRDPAFYDRDTFNLDRLEVMRGSASMLFGRGSTGGAVNQVNKAPRLIDEHQIDLTLGNHNHRRVVGDFNIKTGESAALRLNAMYTEADNDGAGSSLDKKGFSAAYRWGIGERDEFSASLYHLDNNNGINYGLPWIRRTSTSPSSETTVLPLDPDAYYGMASDYNAGTATYATLTHLHRFDDRSELKTQVRKAVYTRDQRASTIRLSPNTVRLDTFGPSTNLTRGTNPKIQDLDTVFVQSDFSSKFNALGVQHEVLAGVDLAQEKKIVYAARSVAQGGMVPVKPPTTVGTPDDGTWVNEGVRSLRTNNEYESTGWGAYAQDMIQIAPHWKLLAGLRYDSLVGDYDTYTIPNNAAGPQTKASYRMKVSEWSQRLGVLYQPNALHSYHVSAATSFNTSGDAYSLSPANVNIDPEKSLNLEIGAKLDSADKRFTTRLALFRSTKLHERNTDPLVNLVTLSGKRHATGLEIDVSGRPTPAWEIYGSFMWIPSAKIDQGVAGSEGQGTRPSNTPKYSGTIWNTYQVTPQWRVGAGLNFRGKQTPIRNPGWEVPSFVTADLMAEYKISEKFMLKANLSNVANKLYADQLYSGHYVPGPGRLFQVTGTMKF